MFREMVYVIKERVTEFIMKVEFDSPEEEEKEEMTLKKQEYYTNRDESGAVKQAPKKRRSKKVGRNDPCPCGSGKKYKQCCG
jgi:preprotein translocase subunit SecA